MNTIGITLREYKVEGEGENGFMSDTTATTNPAWLGKLYLSHNRLVIINPNQTACDGWRNSYFETRISEILAKGAKFTNYCHEGNHPAVEYQVIKIDQWTDNSIQPADSND